MMNVLLISPPRETPQPAAFPPIGLGYIAAVLKNDGHKVRIMDAAAYSLKKIERLILEVNPEIVGLTCWTIERGQTFKVAKLVREHVPNAKIIVGGQHATAFPEQMFKLAYADVVVLGEGERTTSELVRCIEQGGDIAGVNGIVYRNEKEVVYTQTRTLIEDLDTIPFPMYEDFDLPKYGGLPEKKSITTAIVSSRGCPYKCIFCSSAVFWKKRWRARSSENVLAEIEWLYKDYQVRSFIFFDDFFFLNKDRAIEICQGIIDRKLKVEWVAEGRVNLVDRELLGWMKKAGCYRIDYGVESGSPKILKNINKKISVEQIRNAFRLTHELGMKPVAYLMVGNPGETEGTIRETIQLMHEIKPHYTNTGGILWILPNTEIYETSKKLGIIDDDYWMNNMETPFFTGEHSLEELKELRNRLTLGLAKNRGSWKGYVMYLFRKCYDRSPLLQRFYHGPIVKNKIILKYLLKG